MATIEFRVGKLRDSEQAVVSNGFEAHSNERLAPAYDKKHLTWLAQSNDKALLAALTADVLWDWMYIDELWVAPAARGDGLGRQLMQQAEAHADHKGLQGIWLWTQSWQAESFYEKLGYDVFARFDDFPVGHSRIGFRKKL